MPDLTAKDGMQSSLESSPRATPTAVSYRPSSQQSSVRRRSQSERAREPAVAGKPVSGTQERQSRLHRDLDCDKADAGASQACNHEQAPRSKLSHNIRSRNMPDKLPRINHS